MQEMNRVDQGVMTESLKAVMEEIPRLKFEPAAPFVKSRKIQPTGRTECSECGKTISANKKTCFAHTPIEAR